jgi:hypothetical protein
MGDAPHALPPGMDAGAHSASHDYDSRFVPRSTHCVGLHHHENVGARIQTIEGRALVEAGGIEDIVSAPSLKLMEPADIQSEAD